MTVRASAMVQRLAAEAGVDLAAVTGTGEGGRVRAQDVRAAARAHVPEAQPQDPPQRPAPTTLTAIGLDGRPIVQPWLAAENATVACDADVRDLAGGRGVRLRHVRGSGPAGAVTAADVLAVARRQDTERAAAQAVAYPEPKPEPDPRISFTASGIPVSMLSEVPPSVRRALAAAPDHAAAYALVQTYGRLGDDEAAALLRSDRAVSALHGGAGLAGVSVPGWD
ncbi:E3 binding domain-containing protein [uncultured Modestobacter sp.]|uniref:E3 binding domain-containing protein n=1 Tax=uncultured Modestobacter sp. TaxID=380048 RepID=UPI00263879E1|nr:E3 binding domain-containing protein [uncultured Modestobacter sp.]